MPLQKLIKSINEADLWEKTRVLKRNDFLKTAGSTDMNLYYVVEGSLRVYFVNDAEEYTIRFGYQNNFITALDAFISEQPSELYIQALRKTTVKQISKAKYIAFLKSSPELLEIWYLLLGQLIYQQMERERDILTTSPQERYQRVLKRSPQLFQEIPLKYIASYLRMTPETLSRIKKS